MRSTTPDPNANTAPPLRRRAEDRAELQLVSDTERLLRAERVMLRVRWAALAFAFAQIFTFYKPYPSGIKELAIGAGTVLGAGNVALWFAHRAPRHPRTVRTLALLSLGLDVGVVMGFCFVYTFDPETAIWALIYILPLEGAIRFQLPGAMWTMTVAAALYTAREVFGTLAYDNDFLPTSITFRIGIGYIVAAVGGTMASNLVRERTEIERHADALRESEERFRKVFEAGPAGIALVGLGGKVIDANEAFCEVMGYERAELIDRSLSSLAHPEDRDDDEQSRRALLAGEAGAYSLEQRFVRADGSTVWLRVLMALIRGRDGAPRYGIAMVEDVTERRRAERSLREALRREQAAAENLRETDEFKTALLSAVSHDLRTPLTVVLGFSEQLARDFDRLTEADAKMMVSRVVANAQRLERLIVNLLDMDRLTRGIVRPKLSKADLGDLAEKALASVELPGRTVEVLTQPAEAMLDVALVERIIENLLVNVNRHTPPGSSVTVRTWADDSEVVLAIEDRGPGVPDHNKGRIFEPFERGTADHSPGTGVGLSLVTRFAELHGGRAWVEDRAGGGASFRVALPRHPAVEDLPPP